MSSTSSANPIDPTTPAYSDDTDWITAYISIHTMSDPSRRYSFLLWIVVTLIFLVFAVLHWTGSRGGFIGAKWSKWSVRRRTWRKKHSLIMAMKRGEPHRQPLPLPSNAQIMCLCLLLLATVALSVAGPDYIAPGVKIWQFERNGPSASNTKPDEQPQYTIWKTYWTSAGRTGLIAFALMPLCVLFALKAPPFAIFAISFMIQLQFDKLAWLHRWSGRLIWLVTAVHVALWTAQMIIEVRPETGKMVLIYAWGDMNFIWGWIAFGLLTLLIALSIKPIRRVHYESFWFLHVLLVPMMLVASAFHHPQVGWWCWAALALWVGERCWRATWWLNYNGWFGGMSVAQQLSSGSAPIPSNKEAWEMNRLDRQAVDSAAYALHPIQQPTARPPTFKSPLSIAEEQPGYQLSQSGHPKAHYPSRSSSPSASLSLRAALPPAEPYLPPPGYAHAELVSGRTIRLRFLSPGFISWAPGQHFLINIPSVSHFTSHPFTVASICDEAGPESARIIVLLIRAKNGWTRDLWDAVCKLYQQRQPHPQGEKPTRGAVMPARGCLMRMYVDGPFGSSVRARWGAHSSVVIIAGGSGVSFGISVLEYVCMCLSGRDGKVLGGRPGGWGQKGFQTQRVRFVWLVREFSHIQWGAAALHRCLAMVPAPGLQVDIFVTRNTPAAGPGYNIPPPATQPQQFSDIRLVPPTASFAREARAHLRNDSAESVDSSDEDVDLSYYSSNHSGWSQYEPTRTDDGEAGDSNYGLGHDGHILDLTNFDGDDDEALPGEEMLNQTVQKQGKVRRAKTRKATRATPAAMDRLRERRQKSYLGHGEIMPSYSEPLAQETRAQSHTTGTSHGSNASVDRLLSYAAKPGTRTPERRLSTPLEVDLASPTAAQSDAPWRLPPSRTQTPAPMYTEEAGSFSNQWDNHSDIASTRELMMSRTGEHPLDEMALEVDERELYDVHVVSEHTRPGKPKLDRILGDEIENSKGSVIVACCGPTTLNALVRKIIAAKIDPTRIRHGDMRGMISLVSEEFEY